MGEVQEITMSQAEISDRLIKVRSEIEIILKNIEKIKADIVRKPKFEESYKQAIAAEQERLTQLREEEKDLSYRQI